MVGLRLCTFIKKTGLAFDSGFYLLGYGDRVKFPARTLVGCRIYTGIKPYGVCCKDVRALFSPSASTFPIFQCIFK